MQYDTKKNENTGGKKRYGLLDLIRGVTLISMVLYHTTWDLIYIKGIRIDWYEDLPGQIWQKSICCTFILLSGFCWPLARRHVRRGLMVSAGGILVTVVTLLFMPEDRVIFGVLTFLGAAMLLMIPIDRLVEQQTRTAGKSLVGIGISLLFFWGSYSLSLRLPGKNLFTTFWGFWTADFYSTDYFPVFPWLFLYSTGYFLQKWMQECGYMDYCRGKQGRFFRFLGRHSLLIYLLHQPIVYGLLELFW